MLLAIIVELDILEILLFRVGAFSLQTDNSNVNTTTSNVTNHSNNTTNLNSSLSYLNVNNSTSNVNANISSRLLTVDGCTVGLCHCITLIIFVTFDSTAPLGEKDSMG